MKRDLPSLIRARSREWRGLVEAAGRGSRKVMICTSSGFHGPILTHDTLLAAGLTARGVQVEFLLCDGVLSACEGCTVYNTQPDELIEGRISEKHCTPCIKSGFRELSLLGLPVHRYSQYITEEDRAFAAETMRTLPDENLKNYVLEGISLGEEAVAATMRFFAMGDVTLEPQSTAVLRRFLESAIIAQRMIRRLFEQHRPEVAVFHHGIYVPQGIIGQVARAMGIRVVNWTYGYRIGTFVYSHRDTYHRTMMEEPVEHWKNRPLTPSKRKILLDYLESRRNSSQDWIKFNQEPEENKLLIRKTLGLDERPIALLLTNVAWDAQMFYKNNSFPTMQDWVEYSIRYFAQRPDMQLVIRIHPGEVRAVMPSRQPIRRFIESRFPELPENLRIVNPESELSTYALAEMSDCALIFGTKAGVELAARGLPVVIAGEAWVRNKGLTIDVSSVGEYRQCLERLPLGRRMSPEETALAEQYAYHYFFERLMPLKALQFIKERPMQKKRKLPKLVRRLAARFERKPKPAPPILLHSPLYIATSGFDDLKPGGDAGMDALCQGILEGKPFIYPGEPE